MREPHVVRIYYKVTSAEHISYSHPPPKEFEHPLGRFRLADGELAFEPSCHFAHRSDVHSAVSPFLRSWEISADLAGNIGALRFRLDENRVEMIDLNPPGPGEPRTTSVGVVAVLGGGSALVGKLPLVQDEYPNPPHGFVADADTESAYERWARSHESPDRILEMAYFVCTVATVPFGSMQTAAKQLKVDLRVLKTLSELSSTKGTRWTARKLLRSGFDPLTRDETRWIRAVVPRLIRRMGEHAAGASAERIGMDSFCRLPERPRPERMRKSGKTRKS